MPESSRDESWDLKRISEEANEILDSLKTAGELKDLSAKPDSQFSSERERGIEELKKGVVTSTSQAHQSPHPLWAGPQDFIDALNRGDTAFISKRAAWRLDIGIESLMLEQNGKVLSPTYAETGSYFVIGSYAHYWLLPSTETLKDFSTAMIESPHNQHRVQIFDIKRCPVPAPFLALAPQVEPRGDRLEVTRKGLVLLPPITK